jgi:hypothetical protein
MAPMHKWLYLPGGKVAHAFMADDDISWIAECGTSSLGYWHGTGSQDEYERAAELPRCQKCLPRVGASEKGRAKPRGVR